MDIFEMRLQESTRRYPSGYLRVTESRREEIGEETRRVSSSYIAPATVAAPIEIFVEIRVNMDVYHYCEIRDFYRAVFSSL
jgi:hypothetical protein